MLWCSEDVANCKLPYCTLDVPTEGGGVSRHVVGDGGIFFGDGDARNNLGGLHWDSHGGEPHSEDAKAARAAGKSVGGLRAGFGTMTTYGDGYPATPQG